MEWRLKTNQKKSNFLGYDDIWKRKCILLSLRAGVGSYIPPRLVLTMIVRKKIAMKLLLGFKKKHYTDNNAQKYFKKIPGGWLNLLCLRQVGDV